jgi:hypothetical protein
MTVSCVPSRPFDETDRDRCSKYKELYGKYDIWLRAMLLLFPKEAVNDREVGK